MAASAQADPFLLAARIEWRQRREGASAALALARRLLEGATDLATADVARILAGWRHTALANEMLGGVEPTSAPGPEWWRAVAAVAYADGRFEEAEQAYRRLLEAAPSDDSALNDLGYLLAEQGRNLDEAVNLCERAVALRPEEPAYLDSLGWALHRAGRSREALDVLSRAVYGSGDNTDPVMREHLGEVFLALGQVERAVAEWKAALGLSDADGESLRARIRRALEQAPEEP
ncbi:MAG: tetratricopeptide repeat protein [Acidobacteriota bacterium]|nr:tetratricopeptide repeat protein [Acidobacteriota bacterium]